MDDNTQVNDAVELLQQLGLKEYEAKAFVALTRLPKGSAKEISEISDIPRTRVYDAVRMLESKGLVETQHGNPQQFRAVSRDEAAETLRREYVSRTDSLQNSLEVLESATSDPESEPVHEVWELAGSDPIATRTAQLVNDASKEVVLVIGHEDVFTDDLRDVLRTASERNVELVVGTVAESLRAEVQEALPDADVYVSGLEWLASSTETGDHTEIGRLLMVDRSSILVSSFTKNETGGTSQEQAVFGRGFDNGLVTIIRRMMGTGLLRPHGPE